MESVASPEADHTGIQDAHRKLVFVGFDGDHRIELIHYLQPPAISGHLDKHQFGATHVCFDVDDLDETYTRLRSKGVRFVTEPKYKDHNGTRIGIVYARDPEGNWLEFVEGF